MPDLSNIYNRIERATCRYELLGLGPKCKQPEVRTAYKKLALLLHPDKAPDDATRGKHSRLFIQVQTAYESLVNGTRWKKPHWEEPPELPPKKQQPRKAKKSESRSAQDAKAAQDARNAEDALDAINNLYAGFRDCRKGFTFSRMESFFSEEEWSTMA